MSNSYLHFFSDVRGVFMCLFAFFHTCLRTCSLAYLSTTL